MVASATTTANTLKLLCVFVLFTLACCNSGVSTIRFEGGNFRIVPLTMVSSQAGGPADEIERFDHIAQNLMKTFFDDFGSPDFLNGLPDRPVFNEQQQMAHSMEDMMKHFRAHSPKFVFRIALPKPLPPQHTCPCLPYAKNLCSVTETGFTGHFNTALCLADHEMELSNACRARLTNTVALECRADITKFCADTTPGHHSVHKCLVKERTKLSPRCSAYFLANPAAVPAQEKALAAPKADVKAVAKVKTEAPVTTVAVAVPATKAEAPAAVSVASVQAAVKKHASYTVALIVLGAVGAVVGVVTLLVRRSSGRQAEDTPYNAMMI